MPDATPPDAKDLSPQLSNIQNSLYSAIENSKKQQWTITNYVILVDAAIFGLSRALNPPLTPNESRWACVVIAIAGFYAVFLLIQIQANLGTYREQLEAFHNHNISDGDRAIYKITPYRNPALRGVWFLIALIGVVVIGGLLVIYSLLR
jgi:hypothetical protein